MDWLHNFHPQAIAWHLGHLDIHWYGVILASAFIIGFVLTVYNSKQKQVEKDHLYDLFLLLVPFGLIGGRIAHVLTDWGYYHDHLSEIVKLWHGGLTLHGVVLAGLMTVYVYCRVKKLPFWSISDIVIVAVPLMQAIGRWGNYFNQELYGRPTDSPWGIPIDSAHRLAGYEQYAYYHPLFLYESVFDAIIFVVLFVLFRKNKLRDGRLTWLYLILYSIVRFFLDFVRFEPPMIGVLSWGQWVSIIFIVVAGVLWIKLPKRSMS